MSTSTTTPAARCSSWNAAIATAVASGFGSGFSPIAPGTAGSAVGLLLYWPLLSLPLAWRLAVVVLGLGVGIVAADRVARRTGDEDPSLVVVDEIVGMWITLLFLPITALTLALGFFFFRVMDVLKPWPARDLEDLPGGLGVMADDVMAGIYANLCVRVALLVWPVA